MNSVLIKLLSEFREVKSIIENFKPTVLETIEEAEELIENNSKEIVCHEECNDDRSKGSSIDEPQVESQDEPQDESEEESEEQ